MLKLYEPRSVFSMINKNKLKKNSFKNSATHMAFPIWHTVLAHCKSLQVVSPLQTLIHKTHMPAACRGHPLKLQSSSCSNVKSSIKPKLLWYFRRKKKNKPTKPHCLQTVTVWTLTVRQLSVMMPFFRNVTNHSQHRELGLEQRQKQRGGLNVECSKDNSRVISGKN